jgi:hypothetical protein
MTFDDGGVMRGPVQIMRANGSRVTLIRSTSYDSWHQSFESFSPSIELFPGDRIITTCIFHTTYSSSDVVWGETLRNEMCYAHIGYYPAIATQTSSVCFNYQGKSYDRGASPKMWVCLMVVKGF